MTNLLLKTLVGYILFICVCPSEAKVYYVKQDGSGAGSSWENASSSIKKMMSIAAKGDTIWVAAGVYCPELDPYQSGFYNIEIKNGVSMFGGFQGIETHIDQRERYDKDGNGTIENWEFKHETIITGDKDGIPDVWTKEIDADGNWRWNVSGYEGNSSYLVSIDAFANRLTEFDGFTISGGYLHNSDEYNREDILLEISNNSFKVKNCIFSNNIINLGKSDHYKSWTSYSIVSITSPKHDNALSDCLIENNAAFSAYIPESAIDSLSYGCSIINNAAAIMENVKIRNNYVKSIEHAGILWNTTFGILNNCEIYDNHVEITQNKGAIVYAGVAHTMNNTIVRNNIINSRKGGGAVWCNPMSKISNNLIYNNYIFSAEETTGGGIFAEAGSWIINNVVSNNSLVVNKGNAYGGGIGVSSTGARSAVINCIITGNAAHSKDGTSIGGGLYDNRSSEVANYTIQNCAVSNNDASTFPDMLSNSYYYNMITPDIQSIYKQPVSFKGIAKTDAEKTELASADWHLADRSPCIGTGVVNYFVSTYLPKVDMEGNARIVDNTIDMGIYQTSGNLSIDLQKQATINYQISKEGILQINGEKDALINVFDANGDIIHVNSDNSIQLPQRGIYIVKIIYKKDMKADKIIW